MVRAVSFLLITSILSLSQNVESAENKCSASIADISWVDWFSNPQQKKEALLKIVERKLGSDEKWRQAFEDALSLHWLREFRRGRNLVALAVGNTKTDVPETQAAAYISLVSTLIAQGHTILYDADALSARWIEALVPENQRLGISAGRRSFQNSHSTLLIKNAYIRLRLFAMADTVIATPRSALGSGLAILGRASLVFDPSGYYKGPPRKGKSKKKTPRQIEIWAPQKATKEFPEKLKREKPIPPREKPVEWASLEQVKGLDNLEILELLQHADLHAALEHRVDSVESRDLAHRRAVFIGWSVDHEEFRKLVYDSVDRVASRGIPITTGGSMGYMAVANRAAKHAGAPSIGIPFIGLGRLSTEQDVPVDLHTMTLGTSSYETRIPGLFYRQDLVLLGPGSSGTLRELAVAFLEMETLQNGMRVFGLSKSYYGAALNWMKSKLLPSHLGERLAVVDSPEELDSLLGDPK